MLSVVTVTPWELSVPGSVTMVYLVLSTHGIGGNPRRAPRPGPRPKAAPPEGAYRSTTPQQPQRQAPGTIRYEGVFGIPQIHFTHREDVCPGSSIAPGPVGRWSCPARGKALTQLGSRFVILLGTGVADLQVVTVIPMAGSR